MGISQERVNSRPGTVGETSEHEDGIELSGINYGGETILTECGLIPLNVTYTYLESQKEVAMWRYRVKMKILNSVFWMHIQYKLHLA